MEETAVHGSAVEHAERSSVRVGQDGFGAAFGSDPAQTLGNLVESLVPRDAFKSRSIRWSDGVAGRPRPSFPQGNRSLRLYASHRIQLPIRRVNAVQILGDFGAKESAGNGMLRIALNFGSAAVFDSDQNAAGVRAIVRAGGVNDALHPRIIKDSVETGLAPSAAPEETRRPSPRMRVRMAVKIVPRRRKESESRDRKRKSDSLVV